MNGALREQAVQAVAMQARYPPSNGLENRVLEDQLARMRKEVSHSTLGALASHRCSRPLDEGYRACINNARMTEVSGNTRFSALTPQSPSA